MPAHANTEVLSDPRSIRSRQAIRQAFLALLESHPIEEITIRDIALKAGVGYTTFFRRYASKEALLEDLAAEQINCLVNLSLPIADAHDVRAGSTALFQYVDAHRPLWSALLTGGAAGAIRQEYLQIARSIAESREPARGWLPTDLSINLMISGTIELIEWWLKQPSALSVKRVAEIHERIVITPPLEACNQKRP